MGVINTINTIQETNLTYVDTVARSTIASIDGQNNNPR